MRVLVEIHGWPCSLNKRTRRAQACTLSRLARLAWCVSKPNGSLAMGEMDLAVSADVSHPAARGSMENSIGAGRSGPVRLRVFVRGLDTFKVARAAGRTLEAVGNGLYFR